MRAGEGRRCVCQVNQSFCMSGGPRGRRSRLRGSPLLDPTEEQLGERLDLVRREQRGDFLADRLACLVAAEELVRDLVEVGEVRAAEVLELVCLEMPARKLRVGAQLVAVRQVLRGDRKVRLPVEVAAYLATRRGAEERPAQVRLEQPREVIVQRRDLRIG